MLDAGTFWLTVANLLLGLAVLVCVITLIVAIVRDLERHHAMFGEMDRDMRRMFGANRRHR